MSKFIHPIYLARGLINYSLQSKSDQGNGFNPDLAKVSQWFVCLGISWMHVFLQLILQLKFYTRQFLKSGR